MSCITNNLPLVASLLAAARSSQIWDCSNEALKSHELEGLWKLALLTSVIPIFPLLLLKLLPKDQKTQKVLQKNPERSKLGGTIFLLVLVLSLLLVIQNGIETLSKAVAKVEQPEEVSQGMPVHGYVLGAMFMA